MLRSFIVAAVLLPAITLFAQPPAANDTLPPVNGAIVAYVQEHMGEKVGHGECWDLAAGALNSANARWDGADGFGRLVNWKKDTILPGDIIQFEGVTMEQREGNTTQRFTFGQHTAVVMAVTGRGVFTIGHQNFGKNGKKVTLLDLDMAHMRGGKIMFYRPVR